MKPARILYVCLRLGLGGMFLYTGLIHAMSPVDFALAVANYRFLPEAAINFFAIYLPWVEILTGLCLVFGYGMAGASMVSALMLLAFTIALTAALARGLDISCGCFTTRADAGHITWWYLFRDIFLLLASIVMFGMDISFGRHSLCEQKAWKRPAQ
jgi:uncharacterized membrane protein YphA (DoxX/SURF4 family)